MALKELAVCFRGGIGKGDGGQGHRAPRDKTGQWPLMHEGHQDELRGLLQQDLDHFLGKPL